MACYITAIKSEKSTDRGIRQKEGWRQQGASSPTAGLAKLQRLEPARLGLQAERSPHGCKEVHSWWKKRHMQRYDRVRRSHALMDCQTVRAQAVCTGAQWGGRPGEGGQEQVQEGLLCESICPVLGCSCPHIPARLVAGWRQQARLTNCFLGIRQDALPRVDTQQS